VASRAITVNAVAPGVVKTRMTEVLNEKQWEQLLSRIPMGRDGLPEEIAPVVTFLASDEASYLTVRSSPSTAALPKAGWPVMAGTAAAPASWPCKPSTRWTLPVTNRLQPSIG